MSKNVFSVTFCVLISIISAVCQMEEGAECFSQSDNLKGTCVNLRRCRSVVNDIKSKKHPQLCSFSRRDPIICCTDCELVSDTNNYLVDLNGAYYLKSGRKAADKCLEYVTSLNYPCTLLDGMKRKLDYPGQRCYNYEKSFGSTAVGGKDAKRGQFPHMALLGYGDSFENAQWLCGGSIISDRFILTAGHCVSSQSVGTVKYAALGILKRTDPPETWQRHNVRRTIRHPEYKPPSKYNDIALLEVDTRINFNKDVLPACLNIGDRSERTATATGWGTLGHRQGLADTLQVVELQQFTPEECSEAYPPHRNLLNGYNHASQSCYGDKNNQVIDTCEGDSGGPLQISSKYGTCIYNIIGVTSYGRQCGFVGNAGMYTKVEFYVPWIESIVWP